MQLAYSLRYFRGALLALQLLTLMLLTLMERSFFAIPGSKLTVALLAFVRLHIIWNPVDLVRILGIYRNPRNL